MPSEGGSGHAESARDELLANGMKLYMQEINSLDKTLHCLA